MRSNLFFIFGIVMLLTILYLMFRLASESERALKEHKERTTPGSELLRSHSNKTEKEPISLSIELARELIGLPEACIHQAYPNKPADVLNSANDLVEPKKNRPAFYGCFDWHSAVHGHWLMVDLMNRYPQLAKEGNCKKMIIESLSKENLELELAFFQEERNVTYERTYGWAWLLSLDLALNKSNDPEIQELANHIRPLSQLLSRRLISYLPKLVYPIRSGEHTNTAYALTMAYEYAQYYEDEALIRLIENRATAFYMKDTQCPLGWEPSGYDFLSPCLEQAHLMSLLLDKPAFMSWLEEFLPSIINKRFYLAPAQVGDRTDGKLVHLDGLNFSRAFIFLHLAKKYPQELSHLQALAFEHINQSMAEMKDGNYEGEHWLATFAWRALREIN
ncbi:MAG: DUF2891 domain-containing protein [Cyclobacteriaceae bacterium]|nr:DUF2891 domain-containing protein [Cyclobacteriaceae bacterium]MCH8517768.1 DUF2891 domain-containing protein [Cyclobacteriaceae bacterium]